MSDSATRSVTPAKSDASGGRQRLLRWLYRVVGPVRRMLPAGQFRLVSLIVLVAGMVSSGWWLGRQIEARVLSYNAASSALFIESFVEPLIQDAGSKPALAPTQVGAMDRFLQETPLGEQIVAFLIWGRDGRILYSSNHDQIGRVYPVTEDLAASWNGDITWELNNLNDEPHIPPQDRSKLLMASYVPVRLRGSGQVIAVAEFYQAGDQLRQDIISTQWQTWMAIGLVTLAMYLALAGFIQRISDVIHRQQSRLGAQVTQLTDVLSQNAELHERVRRATLRSTTLNERVLRRIGAELHDGPAQQLSLSLLHLDRVAEYYEKHPEAPEVGEHIDLVQNSLTQSLQEVRAISAGLGLPELQSLSLAEVALRAVHTHERRTKTQVRIALGDLPESVGLPIKITLYRILQEGLRNAYRHASGVGQSVRVQAVGDILVIEVADQGTGFRPPSISEWYDHMGLSGMRERVESLGGLFSITSQPGHGTQIRASLPLNEVDDIQN